MPSCASCGAELPPNAGFCSACGAAVAPATAAPASAPIAAATTTAVAVTDVKAWAMWSHLSALGGLVFPFGNILGPLIIWLSKRDEIPEVNVNGKEAMNFQITMSGASMLLWGVSVFLAICSAFLPERRRHGSRGVRRRCRSAGLARDRRRVDYLRNAGIHCRTQRPALHLSILAAPHQVARSRAEPRSLRSRRRRLLRADRQLVRASSPDRRCRRSLCRERRVREARPDTRLCP